MTHPLVTIRLTLKRLYAQEMSALMRSSGLTRMELDVLLFMANNPGYDTAAEIVQLRALTKSHVSRAVEHLTALGLIEQRRDDRNRRRVHLLLTPQATPIVNEGKALQQRFTDILTAGLSAEDQRALERIMRTVSQNAMNALAEEESAAPREQ